MKNRFKKSIILIMAIVLMLVFTSCIDGGNEKPKATNPPNEDLVETTYPYTFKDSKDREVTLSSEPTKVITVGPNLSEIVYVLGKGDLMVGRTDYDDYPAAVLEVESIGDLMTPNIEKLIDLEADIILVSGTVMPESIEQMEANKLTYAVINDQDSFEGVYATIELVGKILNANEEAKSQIDTMKAKVTSVTDKLKDATKVSVYYVVGYGEYGDYTATGDTFMGKMIELAGGDNIAKNETGWVYSKEALIDKDPSLIFCSDQWDTKAGFTSGAGYSDLTAVKEDKVFEVDESLMTRQGPRVADALEELAKLIHPDLFK